MNNSILPTLAMKADELTQMERDTIDKYIIEYIFDKDEEKAAIRMGISRTYAKSIAKGFVDTPYFQIKLKEYSVEKDTLLDDTELLRREIVRNLIDVMKYNGENASQSARIQSAKEISAIMGLATKQQTNTEDEFISGVMVIPASLPIDEWSSQAIASQAALHKQLEASL